MDMRAEMIEELKEKIGDRVLVVSVSGGKDSTATCLHLQELGLPYRAMFFDTGWEHASTYQYLTEYLPTKVGQIERLSSVKTLATPELEALALKYEARLGFASPMVRWCIHKGTFPSRQRRWCTQELKVYPARDYLKAMDDEPINVVGIRAEESKARSKMPEWEWFDPADCEVWRPLIRWTFEDVIAIHQRHNITPNPLYLGDNPSERVGCYPCVYARKSELRAIAARSPDRIALLADLEADITAIAAARTAAKGGKLSDARAWFQNQTPKRDPITGKREGDTWPIHRVIQWARTKHGGRQFELFDALPGEQGCVRWGMCDTGSGEG